MDDKRLDDEVQKKKKLDERTLERILEMVKDEYDAEIERFGGYEVRTGILFAVAAAAYPVMITYFHAPSYKSAIIYQAVVYFLETIAVLSAAYASIRFFLLLRARPIQRIDQSEWLHDSYLYLEYDTCLLTLIKTYDEAIKETRTQTKAKTNHFQHGLTGLSIAIFASIIVVVLLQTVAKGG